MLTFSTGLIRAMMGLHGFRAMMDRGVIELYSGHRPESPNAATPSSPLARITQNGQIFVPGSPPQNGLRLRESDESGSVTMDGTWVCVGVKSGVPSWFRWYWSSQDSRDTSQFYPRVDGDVGVDLILPSDAIAPGASFQLDAVYISMQRMRID